jgi:hypothetical protein
VGAVSRALLAGTIDAEAALERIHARAVGPLGHPPDLAPWCYVWEGLDPRDYRSLPRWPRWPGERCPARLGVHAGGGAAVKTTISATCITW